MATPLDDLQSWLGATGGRLYAGTVPGGLALAEPEQSLLVLGPPRSGKTTALAIPNTLCAPGAVVVTSTKPDVLAVTLAHRQRLGRCWLLDPSGAMHAPEGVERIRWSPVAAAGTWDESLSVARAMAGAARPAARRGESAHWTERAEALLAPLLHAAHLEGAGMDEVVGWVLGHDPGPAAAVLTAAGVKLGRAVLAGIEATDPREQSGIWSSAAGILAAYRSEQVLDHTRPVNFDPARLVHTRDTVYVCAPARHQDLVAPIVVAFLDQARAGAYAATERPAPLTLVLDEMANIAPLPDLPAMVSEGGGQGVLTLGCLQDLSQARERWGPAADGFLSLFGAKVVLPGIGDLATLELVSRLGGEVDVPARSVSRGPWWSPGRGAPTVSWNPHRQRRLPVESVSQQPAGTAILISGRTPPQPVRLPAWWANQVFRAPDATPGAARTIER
ncbi:MAG TPA: type IV secretory system conjugative DNA transfer family protein [Acidimicrobiales bacterium]|nr:type IV secretory system conjugative DNA transfer family protein [Acidimicrobiales bacterium]